MRQNTISIVVTTFSCESLYTQMCLESIRAWKNPYHELIVVVHDESALLRVYLDACVSDGLIDRLVFAVAGHGHTRGYNLGVQYAIGDVVFNICNDIMIGPSLIDDCAWKLRNDKQLGIIGWHWYSEGIFWKNGHIGTYMLRDPANPTLSPEQEHNIRAARWFTGRFFDGIGGKYWVHLCNTAFFGVRRDVLEMVGGGFGPEYSHYWADDFLNYAVLDQGLNVRNFDVKFRRQPYFSEFQHSNMDVDDRRRYEDSLQYGGAFINFIGLMDGGMTTKESVFLHLLAKSIPSGAIITNVGVYLGSSVIVLLNAMRSKHATFNFIDCFDLPGVSGMSAQPSVAQEKFVQNIQPHVGRYHKVNIIKANTLELRTFPPSDFIFVDAGHTAECIEHDARLADECLSSYGVAVFHDYNHPSWPAIKPALDKRFPKLSVYKTMAVYRRVDPSREAYQWKSR